MNDRLAKEAFLDSMLNSVGNFDTGKIPRGYRKMTGSPLGAALVNAAAVGIPTYFAAKPVAMGLTKLKGRLLGQSPQQIEQEMALAREKAPKFRNTLTAVLAGLAGLGTLGVTYVPKSVSKDTGGIKSWLSWSHRADDPATVSGWKDRNPMHDPNFLKKENMQKYASFFGPQAVNKNALVNHPGVPVKYSLDVIRNDKYLDGKTKWNATVPFYAADQNGSGLTSVGGLARGAIRAGFGLGAGYLAGKTLGTIFSAPPAVTQTLSATGALAGMLKNTGVF